MRRPAPLPVASIRLKYVARGEAAARFVPREGDGGDAGEDPDAGGNEASAEVPERGDAAEATGPVAHIAPMQGELDLAPPPPEPAWRLSEPAEATVGPTADPESPAGEVRENTSAPAAGPADWG